MFHQFYIFPNLKSLAQPTFFFFSPSIFGYIFPAVCPCCLHELNMVKQTQGWSECSRHSWCLLGGGARAPVQASQHLCSHRDFWTPRRLLKLGLLPSLDFTFYASGLGGTPLFSLQNLCLNGCMIVSALWIPFTHFKGTVLLAAKWARWSHLTEGVFLTIPSKISHFYDIS